VRRVAVVVGYTCNRCGLNSSLGAPTERDADELARRAGWATVTTNTSTGQVVTHYCRRCAEAA
jgi:cytochrome c5